MPDLPAYKCLAMGIFSDEKPPRGICGFIDWRLNGLISRAIKEGRISGEFNEKVVIPIQPGRIRAETIFLFGLGLLTELTYDRIYTAAYSTASAVDGMLMKSFAFELPGDNRSRLDSSIVMEAMITGFFEYYAQDIEKLANVSSCLVTTPFRLKDVLKGIGLFKSHVKDMGAVDFDDGENSFV